MKSTMISQRTIEQRRELGDFVRAHRERLVPAALGLPAGSRRRTAGLCVIIVVVQARARLDSASAGRCTVGGHPQ